MTLLDLQKLLSSPACERLGLLLSQPALPWPSQPKASVTQASHELSGATRWLGTQTLHSPMTSALGKLPPLEQDAGLHSLC